MIKTLQNTLKQDKERFTVPRSVQDIIPIRRIWPDGVFQFGSKYSKTLRFSDINYAIASKEDKMAMFLSYSELLNALDTGSTTKITINNKRLDRRNFEQEILIPPKGDDLDGGRKEYNAMLLDSGCFSDACLRGQILAPRQQAASYTPSSCRPCRDIVSPNPHSAPSGTQRQ